MPLRMTRFERIKGETGFERGFAARIDFQKNN
jgi:hypothetical protein